MRWPAIIKAVTTAAAGNSVLSGIYGEEIRKSGHADFSVPCLEYTLISDNLGELWAPHVVQWDQFTMDMDDLEASEAALFDLFEHETPQFIEGVYMWTSYVDGAELEGPDKQSFFGRMVRFRYTPIRARLRPGRS